MRDKIIKLRQLGYFYSEIAEILQLSREKARQEYSKYKFQQKYASGGGSLPVSE